MGLVFITKLSFLCEIEKSKTSRSVFCHHSGAKWHPGDRTKKQIISWVWASAKDTQSWDLSRTSIKSFAGRVNVSKLLQLPQTFWNTWEKGPAKSTHKKQPDLVGNQRNSRKYRLILKTSHGDEIDVVGCLARAEKLHVLQLSCHGKCINLAQCWWKLLASTKTTNGHSARNSSQCAPSEMAQEQVVQQIYISLKALVSVFFYMHTAIFPRIFSVVCQNWNHFLKTCPGGRSLRTRS